MPIHLTEAQWADVARGNEVPVRVCDPAERASFVLVKADIYERFKSLFEEDPVTEQERLFQLQQFGKPTAGTIRKWMSTTILTPAGNDERFTGRCRVG